MATEPGRREPDASPRAAARRRCALVQVVRPDRIVAVSRRSDARKQIIGFACERHMGRSTVYEAVNALIKRALVHTTGTDKRRVYVAESGDARPGPGPDVQTCPAPVQPIRALSV